jgi:Fic family protein
VILFELTRNENHPVYKALEVSNGNRQYDFLRSAVIASLGIGRPFLSQHLIKALNFHAIACLHINPGEYRPCDVNVGGYIPPEFYRVAAIMDDFVNAVNRVWEQTDPVVLATYVLWRLNNIHPFINGNGRTARATSYLVLCVKNNGWLRGDTILPELIRRDRDEYVAALKAGDKSYSEGALDLEELHKLMVRLLDEQMQSVGIDPGAANNPSNPGSPDEQAPQP